ncbi:hypothetical protein [Mycobacteroides abscessus]|uniref:hypothetical protein n=1 Tax=Mycobacteroides abscessus TaxID=36809 RepID=UPI0018968C14
MTADQRTEIIEQRKQNTGRKERLWVRGQWSEFDIYRVPVDTLLLNAENHRFSAERRLVEEQLGRSLDPENNPDDDQIIEAILLDTGYEVEGDSVTGGRAGKDYEALKSDWQTRQQESPLWIRPNGLVRNGNRRLSMLKRLQREVGLTGYEYVDAVILSTEAVDELALFEMEQREQLTENLKVRYTDINLLLAIRAAAEAQNIDWFDPVDIDRVAGLLQHIIGNDKDYAVIQLNAIKYMDAYLDDSNQPGQYHKLLRQIERFRDVGKAMSKVEVDYPDDADDMLRVMFAAIRAGKPHGTIRQIRQMFRKDRDRYSTLVNEIDAIEESADTGELGEISDPIDISPLSDDDIDDDDDDEREPPGPNLPNYPQAQVGTAIDNAIDSFQASQTDNVVKTLGQIRNRLDVLTDDRETLAHALESDDKEEVRAALQQVLDWVDEYRGLMG